MTPGRRLRLFANSWHGRTSGSITAFAEALGMQPSNLHKYLSGEREPGASVLARIAELGCNIHWLMSGDGEMYADNEAGNELRRNAGKPADGEGETLPTYPALFDGRQAATREIVQLKKELAAAAAEDRPGLLERLTELLETKMELLMQENLLQKGQIVAYERMLGQPKIP
jgi:transcriptional regulator with XRE-family HTH domain